MAYRHTGDTHRLTARRNSAGATSDCEQAMTQHTDAQGEGERVKFEVNRILARLNPSNLDGYEDIDRTKNELVKFYQAEISNQREQAYADGYKKGVLQNPAVAAYLKEDEAREQARQELLDELEAKLPEFKEDDEHDVFVSKAVNVWDITTEFINAKRKKE